MEIMTIVSIALAVILVIGFLLGFLRSWKKSLIRGCMLLGCLVLSIFLTPKISQLLMSKFVDGLVLSIFGFTLDFKDMASGMLGEGAEVSELLAEGSTIYNLATALLNIVLNLLGFLIIFFALYILTLIIYWIISIIMSVRRKRKSVGKSKSKGWQKLIGGGIGVIASLVFCVGLLSPVFGIMSVCDKFVEGANTSDSASAYTSSFVCGELYFHKDDETIGEVETYLEKYANIKKQYDNSFAGKMLKYTGVDFFGKSVFKSISTVQKGGLKVSLTDESVVVVKVYNGYKKTFIESDFDITEPESVDNIRNMYKEVAKSKVLQSLVVDIVPKVAEKISDGETYLGIEFPLDSEYGNLVKSLLSAFSNTESFSTIDKNILVLFDVIDIVNEKEVIQNYNDGAEIMEILQEKDDLIELVLKTLVQSPKYKEALPKVIDGVFELAYDFTISDNPEVGKFNSTADGTEIDWTSEDGEAHKLQLIMNKILKLFNINEDAGATTSMLDNLSDFGEVIDIARSSQILSTPVHDFMVGFIGTMSDSLGEDVISTLTTALSNVDNVETTEVNEDNWNNENYSYANLFNTIQKTASLADKISTANLNDLTTILQDVIGGDDAVKETIENVISDALVKFVGNNDTSVVFTNMLTTFIDKTTIGESGTLADDLAAGQKIIEVINSKAETSMFDATYTASDFIGTLTDSTVVMDLIKDNATTVSSIKNLMHIDSDKDAIESAIAGLAGTDKADYISTLNSLFGIEA